MKYIQLLITLLLSGTSVLADKNEETAVINENDGSIMKTENKVSADEATNEAGTGYF